MRQILVARHQESNLLVLEDICIAEDMEKGDKTIVRFSSHVGNGREEVAALVVMSQYRSWTWLGYGGCKNRKKIE